jgi:hypothetical protein
LTYVFWAENAEKINATAKNNSRSPLDFAQGGPSVMTTRKATATARARTGVAGEDQGTEADFSATLLTMRP